MVTIHRQNSYDSGILRQNYGIIRGLPMNHTKSADAASDQIVLAGHSCNSWFVAQLGRWRL